MSRISCCFALKGCQSGVVETPFAQLTQVLPKGADSIGSGHQKVDTPKPPAGVRHRVPLVDCPVDFSNQQGWVSCSRRTPESTVEYSKKNMGSLKMIFCPLGFPCKRGGGSSNLNKPPLVFLGKPLVGLAENQEDTHGVPGSAKDNPLALSCAKVRCRSSFRCAAWAVSARLTQREVSSISTRGSVVEASL